MLLRGGCAMTISAPAANPSAFSRAGISAFGVKLPSLALPLEELARVRGVDPAKYKAGLGCETMALCAPGQGVVELAAEAARRALGHWRGDRSLIGLIAVGSESALDMSRPLSAFVAEALGLSGNIRSYEVKHACYGGTLALRQAVEWIRSGAARGRAALVIAADVALYSPEDPGEPTQGGGAVAMIVDAEASIAEVALESYAFSEPAFDFWRPVGEKYPRVDGKFSLECYQKAAESCFLQAYGKARPEDLESLAGLAFHVPFPKMVKKTVQHLGAAFGWSEAEAAALFAAKVEPTMELNRQVGNAYTASLWLSVADSLRGRAAGERIAAFSYGSGYGAELFELRAGPAAQERVWAVEVEADLATRRLLSGEEYLALRQTPVLVA
jgi:hydroxymethylglutaryl-CoA synthase